LPLDPATRALGLPPSNAMEAQVFQNASCNWRCWYCYVPFDLLSGSRTRSAWFTAEDLVALYSSEPNPPRIIDLTGGEPSLVPEWIPWFMQALKHGGLEEQTYLWSDDNLSTDYYFRLVTPEMRSLVTNYRNYGRVCCFKGYDEASFSFNTRAEPKLFGQQFTLFHSLLEEGLDLYAYVTLTTPFAGTIKEEIPRFVDRLQQVHENLPLRTVPLEILPYTPVGPRMDMLHDQAMRNQWDACDFWRRELENRYSSTQRAQLIHDVDMRISNR